MRITHKTIAVFAMMTCGWTGLIAADSAAPYPAELDGATIVVPQLGDILETGLLLGNGDLNGLLHAEKGQLVLRLTKNDVWDARLPTKNDPPLPTLARLKELGASGKWGGKNGNELILPEGVKATGKDSYHIQIVERDTKPGEKLTFTE